MNVFAKTLEEQDPLRVLSNRETQVALYMARGIVPSAIAETLDLSVKTVGTYRERIFKKLGIKSNAELAVLIWRTEREAA